MEWVALLVVIVIIGALLGGNSLGETIRTGCGCLVAIMVVLFLLLVLSGGPPQE